MCAWDCSQVLRVAPGCLQRFLFPAPSQRPWALTGFLRICFWRAPPASVPCPCPCAACCSCSLRMRSSSSSSRFLAFSLRPSKYDFASACATAKHTTPVDQGICPWGWPATGGVEVRGLRGWGLRYGAWTVTHEMARLRFKDESYLGLFGRRCPAEEEGSDGESVVGDVRAQAQPHLLERTEQHRRVPLPCQQQGRGYTALTREQRFPPPTARHFSRHKQGARPAMTPAKRRIQCRVQRMEHHAFAAGAASWSRRDQRVRPRQAASRKPGGEVRGDAGVTGVGGGLRRGWGVTCAVASSILARASRMGWSMRLVSPKSRRMGRCGRLLLTRKLPAAREGHKATREQRTIQDCASALLPNTRHVAQQQR